MSTILFSYLFSLLSILCFHVCFHASRMNIEASEHCLHKKLKNSEGSKVSEGALVSGGSKYSDVFLQERVQTLRDRGLYTGICCGCCIP